MIISGIFGKLSNGNNIKKKIFSLTKQKIKKGMISFNNNDLNILAGDASPAINQGEILKTHDRFLVGKVFSKSNYNPLTEEDLISTSSNKTFVDKYWGNYILINIDNQKNEINILRDPVGQLPFFYLKLSDRSIIFSSEINILYDALDLKPCFNWKYLSAYLLHGNFTTKETPFSEILELPHGCQLTISASTINEELIWNPLDYCSNYAGIEDTKSKIVNTITEVIKSWTSNSNGIFVDFSGGLDSSSLLFCLKQIPKKQQHLKAVNFFSPKVQSSDERIYARKIANEVGVDLIEFDTSIHLPLSPPKRINFKPNKPAMCMTHIKSQQEIRNLAKEYKNTCFMSGHGGDHIFLCPPPTESLCDFLIEKGLKGFGSETKEIAMIYRKPLLPLAKETLKALFSYMTSKHKVSRQKYDFQKAPWFKKEMFKIADKISLHPFYNHAKTTKILPGKFRHIDIIYDGLATITDDVVNHNNPVFYPLFSQPLLELALSIPTYESYSQGYNRYPFRSAISKHFKTNSVWRKDKGETSGVFQMGLKKNKKRIMELCLEGRVAQEKLIDKDLLYKNINDIMNGSIDFQWPLTNLISLEIYMNYWN